MLTVTMGRKRGGKQSVGRNRARARIRTRMNILLSRELIRIKNKKMKIGGRKVDCVKREWRRKAGHGTSS